MNQKPIRYYWQDATLPFDSTSTNPALDKARTDKDSTTWPVRAGEANKGKNVWVYARDDDGLVRGGRFVVFADSAPPKPMSLNAVMTMGLDSVRLMWGMMLDKIDNLATEVRLDVCYGAACTPSTVLQDWTSSGSFPVIQYGGDNRSYVFKKSTTGPMRWRVVFRDRRGTMSVSDPAPFTIP